MKFLIIRFSSIGDIVLTTPVIRCLKTQILTAEVHYLVKQNMAPIVQANPYVDRVYTLDNNMESLLIQLQEEDYDYIIDLHHNLRTLKLKKALGKKAFSFPKLNLEKWLYTRLKWNRLPDTHIVDRYLSCVSSFGIKNDFKGLDYFIPDQDKVKEQDIPTSHLAGYIGWVIGAAHATKKMPVAKLIELCKAVGHPIVLLGGKEDRQAGEEIAAIDPVKIYNACGKFSLHESADLVRRAKLIVAHDTGLMHIAAAFKKPIISLWGNTVPEFGMYPYYGGKEAVSPFQFNAEVRGLSCRPCSKIGYNACPKKHFRCMNDQDLPEIIHQIKKGLGKK